MTAKHKTSEKADDKSAEKAAPAEPTPTPGAKSKDMSADPGDTSGQNPHPLTVTSPAKKNPAGLNVVDGLVQGEPGADRVPSADEVNGQATTAKPRGRVRFDVPRLTRHISDHRKAQAGRPPNEREASPEPVNFGRVPDGSDFMSGGRVYTKAMGATSGPNAWDHEAATFATFATGSKHDMGPLCVVLPPLVLTPDTDAVEGQGLSRSWRNALGSPGGMKSDEARAEMERAKRQTNKTDAELEAEVANMGRPGSAHAGGTELPGRS